MQNKMKNLLFIAPDSLPPGISRAYWLANGLSRYFNVFYIQWEDSRKNNWQKNTNQNFKSNRFLTSIHSFFKSLIPRTRIVKENGFGANNLFYSYLPVMQKGAISHFIGEMNARKISREFNRRSFIKLMKKIEFDCVFHGDNMMLAPVLTTKIPAFFDMQDDFDETRSSRDLLLYEQNYLKANLPFCKKCFCINEATSAHMENFTNCQFEIIPNGADFKVFRSEPEQTIIQLRQRFNAENKKIVAFIGSAAHFDEKFTENLARLSLESDKELLFLLVGKLPTIELPNVINTGLVDPGIVHKYYLASDIGFMPHPAQNSFIKNCQPLKIIQFSAAQKPIITPQLATYDDDCPPNIFPQEYSPDLWLRKIKELNNFMWPTEAERYWNCFSWDHITKNLFKSIID